MYLIASQNKATLWEIRVVPSNQIFNCIWNLVKSAPNLINILRLYITTLESYWLEKCLYYDSRVVIYEHKFFKDWPQAATNPILKHNWSSKYKLRFSKVFAAINEWCVRSEFRFWSGIKFPSFVGSMQIRKVDTNQCDQIGRFLKELGDKFFYKSSPNNSRLSGQFWKTSLLSKNCLVTTIGQLLFDFNIWSHWYQLSFMDLHNLLKVHFLH